MSSSHALGRTSEDLACAFLKSAGWRILERNYRAGHKEIDIIATRARVIAFVEVKARAGRDRREMEDQQLRGECR